MRKKISLNIGGLICLLITIYVIYYLLLKDTVLPFSVSSLLTWGNHCSKQWHILTIGLIPIYLAMIVFGAGMLSIYLGSVLQHWLSKLWEE